VLQTYKETLTTRRRIARVGQAWCRGRGVAWRIYFQSLMRLTTHMCRHCLSAVCSVDSLKSRLLFGFRRAAFYDVNVKKGLVRLI
jgi:hypothetical protein